MIASMFATLSTALEALACSRRPLITARLLPTTVACSSLRCAIIRARMR
jgi:hypothetical protein